MMRVFISYRRSDSLHITGRIHYQLSSLLGQQYVWRDLSEIPMGSHFANEIQRALADSRIVLVIIGSNWVTASDKHGPRLFDPRDFVRLEVKAALDNPYTKVIPVLLDNTKMPKYKDLPPDLHGLCDRQAFRLYTHGQTFDREVVALGKALDSELGLTAARQRIHKQRRIRRIANLLLLTPVVLVVAVLGIYLWMTDDSAVSILPIATLGVGELPYVEVVRDHGAIFLNEARLNHQINAKERLYDGDRIASQKATVRAVLYNGAFAIVQPVSIVEFVAGCNTHCDPVLRLMSGKIYVEKGQWDSLTLDVYNDAIYVPYSVVAKASSFSISYDEEADALEVACFTGLCDIKVAEKTKPLLELESGQKITFASNTQSLDQTQIESIPPSEYEAFNRLCGGDCSAGTSSTLPSPTPTSLPIITVTASSDPTRTHTPPTTQPSGPTWHPSNTPVPTWKPLPTQSYTPTWSPSPTQSHTPTWTATAFVPTDTPSPPTIHTFTSNVSQTQPGANVTLNWASESEEADIWILTGGPSYPVSDGLPPSGQLVVTLPTEQQQWHLCIPEPNTYLWCVSYRLSVRRGSFWDTETIEVLVDTPIPYPGTVNPPTP